MTLANLPTRPREFHQNTPGGGIYNSVCCAGLTCSAVTLLEFFQAARFRTLRAAMFAGLGLWGVVPAAHGWLLNYSIDAVRQAVAYDVAMGAVYLVRTILNWSVGRWSWIWALRKYWLLRKDILDYSQEMPANQCNKSGEL